MFQQGTEVSLYYLEFTSLIVLSLSIFRQRLKENIFKILLAAGFMTIFSLFIEFFSNSTTNLLFRILFLSIVLRYLFALKKWYIALLHACVGYITNIFIQFIIATVTVTTGYMDLAETTQVTSKGYIMRILSVFIVLAICSYIKLFNGGINLKASNTSRLKIFTISSFVYAFFIVISFIIFNRFASHIHFIILSLTILLSVTTVFLMLQHKEETKDSWI
ncbi:hypothetical protein BVG16_29745 [Paenibacillus selenitireducens]|uniref:Uncharacterized protein n=1 Tax=Paenibacillus selenitireducens TaxID=1324314 RepID=A0A1T2X061_9BACL|nr:hypothetical protein [Paenibacillus selenitireducens]OPA73264.1 hypothetical protein BVG16_29745 [Paenibacillus selenitireducens]